MSWHIARLCKFQLFLPSTLWSSQVFWCAGQHFDRIFSHLLHQFLGAQSKSGTLRLPRNAKENSDAAWDPFFKGFEIKHIHKKVWISKTCINFLGIAVKPSGIERNGRVFLGKTTGNHSKVDLNHIQICFVLIFFFMQDKITCIALQPFSNSYLNENMLPSFFRVTGILRKWTKQKQLVSFIIRIWRITKMLDVPLHQWTYFCLVLHFLGTRKPL